MLPEIASQDICKDTGSRIAKEFAGRTILFAAVMHSTHDTVLYLLKQGSDPRHRDVMNKRASDVVKERRDKLINRMKDIWNGEGKSMLDEEETIKADIKDVEITSKLLQVYMTGERLVNLSSGVKCWKLVQVRVLQGTHKNFCNSDYPRFFSSDSLICCALPFQRTPYAFQAKCSLQTLQICSSVLPPGIIDSSVILALLSR